MEEKEVSPDEMLAVLKAGSTPDPEIYIILSTGLHNIAISICKEESWAQIGIADKEWIPGSELAPGLWTELTPDNVPLIRALLDRAEEMWN